MPALSTAAFLGLALIYAAVGTVLLGAAARLLGRRPGLWGVATLYALLLFMALVLHPLPDPAALRCPVPDTEPNLRPLASLTKLVAPWPSDVDWREWITWSGFADAAMNLLLCVLIGGLLAGYSLSRAAILGAGFGLSLLLELTQLTGMWGLYPCAFRKFDVDDILLNTLGVALGLLLVRRLKPRRTPPRPAGSAPP